MILIKIIIWGTVMRHIFATTYFMPRNPNAVNYNGVMRFGGMEYAPDFVSQMVASDTVVKQAGKF
jgi:hypothetical protein